MNKNIRERRLVEFKALEDNDEMIIEGYAITFDSPATHWGMTEIIDRNALIDCDMKDVPLRYNHEENHLILARTRNNSLQLTIDDKGLKIRASLIDTNSNKDIYKSIKAGLIDKMSFAFTTTEEEWNSETKTRTIKAIDKLYDVSVVDVPFYDSTEVYARKLDTTMDFFKRKKKEELLRKLKREELLNRL